ncbi:phosphodiesterase [Halorubrum sp. JWXQ-INN 858]|uniref:alkaline phosphatase family protein n=1 Tax=Halorubrum sp. JWXQ-INN 858 TaxID=2690782 RepID=UPI00135CA602|nr:alkaline phosphatase family protein [Halorubrum sp. JWXQ-INN 858]MWV65476.1 phosphodiesterase [Halorubrum sp. JWXQ-INN 858]
MTESNRPDGRTLVFGVDALCEGVLSRLPPGTAPTMRSLIAEGTSGPLESQLPPWTPSAWPSIYTGVNPGKHGVYGFLRFTGYDWDVVNATDVREHALWELLSEQGLRSVVVNVPVTHPPATFDGALIPGYTAPSDPDCHPEGLLDTVREEIGEYRLYNRQLSEGATRDERVNGYETVTAQRGDAFRFLIEREDPDFGFIQFQQSDTVFHEFPEDADATERVYAAIDAEIEETIEAVDPETVVLVSDHGIGPYDGYEVRPNSLLRDRGYVETSTETELPSWSELSKREIRADPSDGDADASGGGGPSAAERVLSSMAAVGLTSQRIGTALRRLRLDGVVLKVVPSGMVKAASEHVDFAGSTAYMRDRIELGVRINLAGREPDGIVDPDEYEAVRSELIDLLTSLRTPDGTPAFENVVRREEVFEGPYVDEAPDIVVVPTTFDQYLTASVREETFGSPREPWNHKLHGTLAIAGDGIDAGEFDDAHLLDVAPTVLASFGLPPSDRMDGEVLAPFDAGPPDAYPEYQGATTSTDDAAIEDRLADLGYLE